MFRFRLVAPTVLSVLILAGCDGGPRTSGIPAAFNSDAPLQRAGAAQGISINPRGSSATTAGGTEECERHAAVTLATGTRVQLLAAYLAEVQSQVRQRGATVKGLSQHGPAGDLRAFTVSYTWKGNVGFVRVRSVVLADGSINFDQLAYEHER